MKTTAREYYEKKIFWKNVPLRSFYKFLVAIFFNFGTVGFVTDIMLMGITTLPRMLTFVMYSGTVAVGWAYSFTRNIRFLVPTLMIQIGFWFLPLERASIELSSSELQQRLIVDGIGIIAFLVVGYIFFIMYISGEGFKQIKLRTEMELARRMHQTLVPDVTSINARFEIAGKSNPAEDVGGDLIDVLQDEKTTTCYIADAAGHGVAPGLMMGMFKSALYAGFQRGDTLRDILEFTNESMFALKQKNMFVTAAFIRFHNTSEAEFACAGHLPILHFSRKTGKASHLHMKQLPVALKPDHLFQTEKISYSPGDLFVLLTDGITEIEDENRHEIGLEHLEKLLADMLDLPPIEILTQSFSSLRNYGPQKDDESLLLIRAL